MFTSNFSFCQHRLSGEIKDSLNNSLNDINILVFKNDTLKAFTFSQNGLYEIGNLSKGKYRLEVSSMTFENSFKIIELDKDLKVDFILKSKLNQIDEVVIDVERDIEVKGDTIVFRADAFNKKKNIVVEDLLRSIPGISVDQDGTLKFQGKLITNVKIDNDDLFDGGYSVLTRNLNADIVDKIEVLQNYSKNPLLKNIKDTEDIAINLKLVENRKSKIFGNLELGFANRERYDANSNLISLLKKSKHYLFLDFNTIGDDAISDINGILSSKNNDQSYNLGKKESNHTFTSLNTTRPVFDDRFVNFNDSKFINTNSIYNLSKNIKLKALGILFSDTKDYFSQNITTFITEDPFTLVEDFNTEFNQKLGLGKVSLEWEISKQKRLEYEGSYYNLNSDGFSELVQNQTNINEDLNSKTSRHNHFIHFTTKVKDSSAFVISSRYIDEIKPQEYLVEPYLFGNLFLSENESRTFDQTFSSINSRMSLSAIQLGFLSNYSKFNYEGYIGFKNRTDDIDSQLIIDSINSDSFTANDDFENHFNLESNLLYFNNRFRFSIGKFDIFSQINLNLNDLTTGSDSLKTKSGYFFLNSSLNLKYQPNKKHEVIAGFETNGNVTNSRNTIDDFVQVNYRTFYRGLNDSELIRNNIMYFDYRFGNWADKFSANLNFKYIKNKNFLSSSSEISPEFNLIERILLDDSDNYFIGVNVDRYLNVISSNIKLKTDYSQASYMDVINGNQRNVTSSNLDYGFEMRSVLKGFFNFTLGTEWRKIRFKINNNEADNINNKSFLDIDINLSENFNISLINERYAFGNLPEDKSSYYFTNIEAKYRFNNSNFSSFLRINNLYDNDYFEIFSLSDITRFTSRTPLIRRYFMFGLNYKF